MATIPLPERSQAPGAAPLSRIPVASYNQDYQRLGAVASRAYMQPELPKNWNQGDVIAGNAWGEALQNLGKVGVALALEGARIQNEKDVLAWDNKMNEMATAYRSSLATNTDTRTWQPGWERQVEGLQKALSTDKTISPAARHAIEMRLSKFNSDEGTRIQFSALKENLNQLNTAYGLHTEQAIQARNFPAARGFVDDQQAKGFLSEPEADVKRYQIDQAEREVKLDNLIGNDVQSARNAASLFAQKDTLSEFNLSPYEKQQYLRKAESAIAFHEARNAETVVNHIITGDIRNEQELEVFKEDVSPQAYEDLRKRLTLGLVNDDAEYQRMFSQVSSYNASSDESGIARAKLDEQITTKFDSGMQAELKRQLDDRATATKAGISSTDSAVTSALNEADADMDAGKRGVFKIKFEKIVAPDAKLDEDTPAGTIRWNPKDKTFERSPFGWEPREWVPIELDQETQQKLTSINVKEGESKELKKGVIIEDLKTKKRAAEITSGIKSELIKKVKSKDLKSGEEVIQYYRGQTHSETLNEARSLINPAQAPVTGDLPNTNLGGGIDPALFQTIYNQTR